MKFILSTVALFFTSIIATAQINFEIQIYPSETIPKKETMVELHSNFTFAGTLISEQGITPTHDLLNETIEITHGFTDWFETGFYLFTSRSQDGYSSIAGSRIRPRVMAPEKWKLPVGLSLSMEIGPIKQVYGEDDWVWEIRPIIDKKWKGFYISFNGAIEKPLHGASTDKGFEFGPNIKLCYDFTKKAAFGLEYYAGLGKIARFYPYQQEYQQLFITTDLNVSKDWEFNAGYGFALNQTSDNGVFKIIVGRYFRKKES